MLEGFFAQAELEVFSRLRLTSVIHALDQVRMLESATLAAPLDVYLKVNTGMNRLGLAPAHVAPALARLRACRNVAAITLMTHFADADGPPVIAGAAARGRACAAVTVSS